MCDREKLSKKLTEVRFRLLRKDFCSEYEKDILVFMGSLIESILQSDTMMKDFDSRRIKHA